MFVVSLRLIQLVPDKINSVLFGDNSSTLCKQIIIMLMPILSFVNDHDQYGENTPSGFSKQLRQALSVTSKKASEMLENVSLLL